MGKHDASRHSRDRGSKKKAPKALLWVILGVVTVAAVAVVLVCTGAFRPAEVEMAAMGEETVERPAVEEPKEAPGEEDPEADGAARLPQDGQEEAPGEEASLEEPEEAPVEEEAVTGEFAPELEILPADGGLTAEEYAAGETMAQVDVSEYITWLTAGAGESHHMYVQDTGFGVAATEFITRDGIIVTSAESTYVSVAGMDDATVEGLSDSFTITTIPAECADSAELFWERQGDWLILVAVLRELDDPTNLACYGDAGLMRIVNGDSYTLSEAEDFLFELGYVKQ